MEVRHESAMYTRSGWVTAHQRQRVGRDRVRQAGRHRRRVVVDDRISQSPGRVESGRLPFIDYTGLTMRRNAPRSYEAKKGLPGLYRLPTRASGNLRNMRGIAGLFAEKWQERRMV